MARAKLEAFGKASVRLAGYAKALAHPARVDIMKRLIASGELPCMTIVENLPLSQPACSRHINALLHAGLLKSRTVRTQILFRVDPKVIESFCSELSVTLHSSSKRSKGGSSRGT